MNRMSCVAVGAVSTIGAVFNVFSRRAHLTSEVRDPTPKEIIIVGAGVSGLGAAYALRNRANVTVLHAPNGNQHVPAPTSAVMAGSSSTSYGILDLSAPDIWPLYRKGIIGVTFPSSWLARASTLKTLWGMWTDTQHQAFDLSLSRKYERATEVLSDIQERSDVPFLSTGGRLALSGNKKYLQGQRKISRTAVNAGAGSWFNEPDLIAPSQMSQVSKALRMRTAWGLLFKDDVWVNPPLMLIAMKACLQEDGVKFIETTVTGVTVAEGTANGVLLEDGSRLKADAIVVATGAAHGSQIHLDRTKKLIPIEEFQTKTKSVYGGSFEVELNQPLPATTPQIKYAGVIVSPLDGGRRLRFSTGFWLDARKNGWRDLAQQNRLMATWWDHCRNVGYELYGEDFPVAVPQTRFYGARPMPMLDSDTMNEDLPCRGVLVRRNLGTYGLTALADDPMSDIIKSLGSYSDR